MGKPTVSRSLSPQACSSDLTIFRYTKMKVNSQVLQLPIVIKRSWPFSFDPQASQELDLMWSGIAGQRRVLKKFPKPRFFLRLVGLCLNVFEFLGISRRKSPAQCNLHSESYEVDIPELNERLQKGH